MIRLRQISPACLSLLYDSDKGSYQAVQQCTADFTDINKFISDDVNCLLCQ